MTKTLRFILGDQLSHDISSLNDIDKENDLVWLCEVSQEATYVKHHKKKIAFLFSAMRHFAQELRDKGCQVHYTTLDDAENAESFRAEVARAVKQYKPDKIVVTEGAEYRVLEDMKTWQDDLGVPVD
ncbi:MAG TPA: cryptochrome/photolyase family protein, partial [Alphaproteobacteria bacterium]|nr:cryptochrome/photolyase family protein [Alphaproteobacteria bacterium]